MSKMVLGLDLGTNSVGWSLLGMNDRERSSSIIAVGSRIFEAGMKNMESDKPVSRATDRRDKRLIRRQLARRRRRMGKLRNLLQNNGLLTAKDEIAAAIRQIDADSLKELKEKSPRILSADTIAHVLPYYLRLIALDRQLSPHVLGRIIYHLAQRRGFLSNRKVQCKEDKGTVKEDIAELRTEMESSGARTLGEFFSWQNPAENRIRTRWTARDMYENEFNLRWV